MSKSDCDQDAVKSCITDVRAAGSFATSRVLDLCLNPGIAVDEREPIALPLSAESARALAELSTKAPFGKNNQTLVDESVRKTLEISADRIRFCNDRWPSYVEGLAKQAAHELGVPPDVGVRAELYKNLLYGPGAMFKAHKECVHLPPTLVQC